MQEGAIVVDVSCLKTIAVDKSSLTARVGAGVTGQELYTCALRPSRFLSIVAAMTICAHL